MPIRYWRWSSSATRVKVELSSVAFEISKLPPHDPLLCIEVTIVHADGIDHHVPVLRGVEHVVAGHVAGRIFAVGQHQHYFSRRFFTELGDALIQAVPEPRPVAELHVGAEITQ
jgi:hypothetical protein